MQVKRKKAAAILFTLCYIVITITSGVYAYAILPNTCNFSTNQYNLSWYYVNQGSIDFSYYASVGAYAWNNSAAPVYWHVESDFGNMKVYNQFMGNTGWHGACKPPRPDYFPNNGWIIINETYYLDFVGNSGELVAHEFGHALRLDDVTNLSSLMRYTGYKGSAIPIADDVSGVDSVY